MSPLKCFEFVKKMDTVWLTETVMTVMLLLKALLMNAGDLHNGFMCFITGPESRRNPLHERQKSWIKTR